jgi:integrase
MSLYKRKDSSVFWVKITVGGRTIQESSGTNDQLKAQEYHDRRKVELWEQNRMGVKPKHSWQEAVVRWLKETADKASHQDDVTKLKWLHPILGSLMLDEITQQVIADIKDARVKVATKSTANRYLSLIRSILIRARDEWEWCEKVVKVKLFKEPKGRVRFLTPSQVKVLLEELPVHQRDIVLFALQTGLRQSNVLSLEWTNINLATYHMWVQADDSKNGEYISVPLNIQAMEVLHRQMNKHPVHVFTYHGKPLAAANTRAWKEALKRAGIENFRWHDLRHTWASWHRMNGTPTHELQQLGG